MEEYVMLKADGLDEAIIGVGSTIFGIILIQSSILLYAMVKLMRNKKLRKNYS